MDGGLTKLSDMVVGNASTFWTIAAIPRNGMDHRFDKDRAQNKYKQLRLRILESNEKIPRLARVRSLLRRESGEHESDRNGKHEQRRNRSTNQCFAKT